MDPKLTRDDWPNPDLEDKEPALRLARLWMKTNPDIDLLGAFRFSAFRFRGATGLILVNSVVVGSSVTGPASITFSQTVFRSSLTDATGAGTITWAGSSMSFKDCTLDGLFTFVGTRFSTVEGIETFFNGISGGKSVSASGTRPATYRFWACGFKAGYMDLLPEVLRDWIVLPADVGLSAGNLVSINATNEVIAQTMTGILEGVLLGTVLAADPAVVVRDGELFVDAAATVDNGDYMIVDAAGTPTQGLDVTLASALVLGQTVGRALEDDGITVAGKAYTSVHVR